MTVVTASRAVTRWGDQPLFDWLIRVALGAVLAELLILRTATRTAIHIPGIDRFEVPFRAVAESGRFAYYLAVVLVVVTLVAMVVGGLRSSSPLVASGAGLFLVAAVAGRAGIIDDLSLAGLVVIGVIVASAGAMRLAPRIVRPSMALFAAAFVVSGVRSGAQLVTGAAPRPTAWLLVLAEGLAVAAPALLAWRLRRSATAGLVLAGLVVGGSVTAALVAVPATTKILMLWNLGLAGYFPAAVYGLATGAAGYGLAVLIRAGEHRLVIAIGLLLAGGIGLHSTYQSALVVSGICLGALAVNRIGAAPVPVEEPLERASR